MIALTRQAQRWTDSAASIDVLPCANFKLELMKSIAQLILPTGMLPIYRKRYPATNLLHSGCCVSAYHTHIKVQTDFPIGYIALYPSDYFLIMK